MIPETGVFEGTALNHVIDDKPDHDDWVRVAHDTPEADRDEAGFDLTTFGSAEVFRLLLNALDLNPETNDDAEYAKVDKNPTDSSRQRGVFVWANEDLALITGNNPRTGEYSDPDMRGDEKGYASYMGLSGQPDAVQEAFDLIEDRADHIKEADRTGRQFI